MKRIHWRAKNLNDDDFHERAARERQSSRDRTSSGRRKLVGSAEAIRARSRLGLFGGPRITSPGNGWEIRLRERTNNYKKEEPKKMGYTKGKEVRGYGFEDGIVCCDCATRQELEPLKEEQVITNSQIKEEDYSFCDRCEELL